jgi:5-amino-6-(5-phospho-D-ribitylamino)uracil phosphatase
MPGSKHGQASGDSATLEAVPPPADAVQLVAIDVDGTLLRTDKRLSRKVLETINEATRRGVRVILATARPPRSVREIHRYLGLDTLSINYNGALIHDPVRRRNVHHQPLAGALVKKIVAAARRVDPKVIVSIEILDKWYTDHVDEELPTETSRAFMPDFVGELEAFLHVPVTKLMLLAPPDRLPKIRAVVERKFKGKVALAVSDNYLLQVVHPHVDKGAALARIAREYGVPARHVMAIGDAPNDVGMLRWAGLGVAVGNAWPQAREAADAIVPANDEDGVAIAIRRFVLGDAE